MGYKYKGNLPYGPNGTSYIGRNNSKLRFGSPGLHESQDFFNKDDDRRNRNPYAFQTSNIQFNTSRTGWVEERSPASVSNRKGDQPQLQYDNTTRPTMVIDSKEKFDKLLSDGDLDNTVIPYFYRQLKYPSTIEDQYPHSYSSALIFRQQELGLIKRGYDNLSTGDIGKTGFYISSTYQWGTPAVLSPDIPFTSSIIYTNAIYTKGGFEKTFTSSWNDNYFIVEPKGTFNLPSNNYNSIKPEGSMLSNLIDENLIKGEQQEVLFSGYRGARLSIGLGL